MSHAFVLSRAISLSDRNDGNSEAVAEVELVNGVLGNGEIFIFYVNISNRFVQKHTFCWKLPGILYEIPQVIKQGYSGMFLFLGIAWKW